MARIISKNSKIKFGLSPPDLPVFHTTSTEQANIPVWQKDGTVKYVSPEDFVKLTKLIAV